MKLQLKSMLIVLGLVAGFGSFMAAPVGAINVIDEACPAGSTSKVCAAKDETVAGPIQTVISVLLFAIGIISVVMIIVGGMRYTLSNGDSSKITTAKNTVLYAVIGLIVAVLAFTIVNFVLARF